MSLTSSWSSCTDQSWPLYTSLRWCSIRSILFVQIQIGKQAVWSTLWSLHSDFILIVGLVITVESQPVRPVACLERFYLLQVSPSGPLLSAAWLSADAEQPSAWGTPLCSTVLQPWALLCWSKACFIRWQLLRNNSCMYIVSLLMPCCQLPVIWIYDISCRGSIL